jgi:hypothetical protein
VHEKKLGEIGMKTRLLKVVLVAVVLSVFACNAWAEKAQDPNQPAKEPQKIQTVVKGTVSVTKDDTGKITAIKITGKKDEHVYEVVLDAKGLELCGKLAGKIVRATGTVEIKDGVNWLTVEKCTEPKDKPAAEKPAKPVKK